MLAPVVLTLGLINGMGAGAGVAAAATPVAAPVATPVAAPASMRGTAARPVSVGAVAPLSAAAAVVQPPTPEEVEQARRAAQASAAAAAAAQQRLEAAQAQLDVVASEANEALERYQQAVEAHQAAQQREVEEQTRLDAAETALSRGQDDLGRWASQAYRSAEVMPQYTGMVRLLQRSATDETAQAMAIAQRLGASRNNAVTDYEMAQRRQAEAAERAVEARQASQARAEQASKAKEAVDALVAQQSAQVKDLTALQTAATGVARNDATRADNLATARAVADAEAAAAAARAAAEAQATAAAQARSTASSALDATSAGAGPSTGGDCAGSSTAGYPNGLIPRSALCPLWGASGHVLRVDAAEAFNRLSQAYAQEFSRPMCVTDSYRTLTEQIDVKRRKPDLAATPGTSRHGLGIAVDLGCGVQNFGSPQFIWLKRNAALFGWLHPAWAERANGPFEPWHWEYTG